MWLVFLLRAHCFVLKALIFERILNPTPYISLLATNLIIQYDNGIILYKAAVPRFFITNLIAL